MPYIPAKDRPALDAAVEEVALGIVAARPSNGDLHRLYQSTFAAIVETLSAYVHAGGGRTINPLAKAVWEVGLQYNYEFALLGALNYAITRLIQRVPQLMVADKQWEETEELRYWLYAITVDALNCIAVNHVCAPDGVAGVFVDIKDEYKWRVNRGYEIAQIIKNGDSFDTPYYSRLAEVTDDLGRVGYVEVFMKRDHCTPVSKGALSGKIKLV